MADSWPACCLAGLVVFRGKQKSYTSPAAFCTFPDVVTKSENRNTRRYQV